MTDTEDQKKPPPVRRSRLRRGLVWLGGFLVVMSLAVGGAILWLTDRPMTAPDWLRDRVEARIAQNAEGVSISFGEMVLTVYEGWRPQVQLRDVEFVNREGRSLLALSELDASLSIRPLLRGQVQPKTVLLSGIFATLRRDVEGRLALAASQDGNAPVRRAATMPELVEQLDDLFLRPEMEALTSLDVDAVTLRFEDASSGRAWTIDGARLRVQREDTDLAISADLAVLGGGAGVATMEANYSSQIGAAAAQFGVNVADMPAQDVAAISPAFEWLGALRAPISGALRSGVTQAGALTAVNATLQIGQGVVQPTDATRPIPFDSARAYFTFEPSRNELVFDQVTVDSAWGAGQVEGSAQLAGLDKGHLHEMIGQFRVSDLRINPPNLYPEPLALKGAELEFRLRPAPFQVDLGQVRIVDADQSMLMRGALKAAPDGWDLALDGSMAQITPERLLEVWPPLVVPATRDWLTENLYSGALSDLEFALRLSPGQTRPNSYFSFAFDEAEVQYVRGLPTVREAKGVASMLDNRFVVTVENGKVAPPEGGEIDIAGSAFIVPDVTVKDGAPAVIRLRTDSTITAAMSLLDQAPLSLIEKTGLPITLANGRARAEATLAVPLKKGVQGPDVEYSVNAQLRNVETDKLVADRTIKAPRLALKAHNSLIQISGKGTFEGVPVDAEWQQALGSQADGSSRVVADVELSNSAVTALNLGLPKGSVNGSGRGTLQVDLARGKVPNFRLTSALSGVGLSVPALNWSMSRRSQGKLEVAGTLGDVPALDRVVLEAPGLSATGRVSLRSGGGLDVADFDRVRLGGWLDAPVRLIGRGTGAAPGVELRGGSVDLRKANFTSGGGGGGSGGQSGPMSLVLNKLQITDTISLSDFQGSFTLTRGLQGQFSGKVNGSAPVTGQVEPQNGRSAFRIKSSNAGRVFAAAGLLKQARGGDMALILQPVGTAGAFNGSLTIQNTRVKDAPAIAALFNALSVVGLLEQMAGAGVHFAEVEAAFRLTPEKVTLTRASAVGPSIGLSMDGTYDVNTSKLDMRGVFSPIYLINSVGSILTRKGEGLIGFNFRLTGAAASPKVQVNPLSALTPSIFREIFRRPAPTVEREPGEGEGTAPRVQPAERSQRRDRIEDEGPTR